MKALRWTTAGLLGLLGGVLGLVGLLLCATVILAPLGIPILFLSWRLIRSAGDMVVPRKVRHPIDALADAGSDAAGDISGKARKRGRRLRRSSRRLSKRAKRHL